MDYTRMTQHGTWTGWLTIDGTRFDLGDGRGGVRATIRGGSAALADGTRAGAPPTQAPQFFWNWAPVNFDDLCTLYTVSEYSDGSRWHESGAILTPYPDSRLQEVRVSHELSFAKGTRHLSGAVVTLTPAVGDPLALTFRPQYHFLMQGIGYGEPKWGHGMWVGPNEVDGGEYDLATTR